MCLLGNWIFTSVVDVLGLAIILWLDAGVSGMTGSIVR